MSKAKLKTIDLKQKREYRVGLPANCPFRQINEETLEVWCDLLDIENHEHYCEDRKFFPTDCPLLDGAIIVSCV